MSNVYGTVVGGGILLTAFLIPGTALVLDAMPQWGISPALGVGFTATALAVGLVASLIIAKILPEDWLNDKVFMSFLGAVVIVLSTVAAAGIFAVAGAPLAVGEIGLILAANLVGFIAIAVLAAVGTCGCCCGCCGQACSTNSNSGSEFVSTRRQSQRQMNEIRGELGNFSANLQELERLAETS